MRQRTFSSCPFCGCERFTVDWSSLDKREEPYMLQERHTCEECGGRLIQDYKYRGWHDPKGRNGEDYLENCPECGAEDMDVEYGNMDPIIGNLQEEWRCNKCGARHYKIWEPTSWTAEEIEMATVNVIDHERIVVEPENLDGGIIRRCDRI